MKSAYIMPHPPIARHAVGRGEEEKIRATLEAYRKASEMIAADAPETIVVISPHNLMFRDAFYIAKGSIYREDLSQFGAPQDALELEYDTELSDEIAKLFSEHDIPFAYDERGEGRPDHGTAVPLLFVNEAYEKAGKAASGKAGYQGRMAEESTGSGQDEKQKGQPYRVVRIAPCLLGNDTLKLAGNLIERAAAHVGRKMTFLASGDLSHKLKEDGPYGLAPEGAEFDAAITKAMKEGDFKAFCGFDDEFLDSAAECGLPGFIMMTGALSDYIVTPEFLSYEGTFGVGYAVCAFHIKDRYVELAKQSIDLYVREKQVLKISEALLPEGVPESMTDTQAGVFVSIHKNGELRGCIGTILPAYRYVAEEVIRLAIEACSTDPRFFPVEEEELPFLEINVDVLSAPEPATREMLDAKRYGVIVTNGYRRGLLLPDLEGVDTPEEQIRISLQKARIDPSERYSIERFTVERHI